MRMQLTWQAMRGPVIKLFPKAPGLAKDKVAYLKTIDEAYAEDAYRVTPALIERVRSGAWNPDKNEDDVAQRNALAARGTMNPSRQ